MKLQAAPYIYISAGSYVTGCCCCMQDGTAIAVVILRDIVFIMLSHLWSSKQASDVCIQDRAAIAEASRNASSPGVRAADWPFCASHLS